MSKYTVIGNCILKKGTELILDEIQNLYRDSQVASEQVFLLRAYVENNPSIFHKQDIVFKWHPCPENNQKTYRLQEGHVFDRIAKPTIGIMPQFIWREQRVKELQETIERHDFKGPCNEWIDEWNEHVNWLMNRKKIL